MEDKFVRKLNRIMEQKKSNSTFLNKSKYDGIVEKLYEIQELRMCSTCYNSYSCSHVICHKFYRRM